MQSATSPKPLFRYRPAFFCLALLIFSFLSPSRTFCNETIPASSSFQAGQKTFADGDYEQALALFKQARRAGLAKPALFYNIGVCAYKLGLYEEASKAFHQTATFPKMAALAYYNLAVVAEKQGDLAAALSWLQKVSSVADKDKDEKLILLAQTALSRIHGKQELADKWLRYVALGFGYDDNVAMEENEDLEATSDEGDSFTDVFAFFRSPLLGEATSQGPFLQGSLSFRDYSDLQEYDVGSLRLDGRYRQNAGDFKIEAGIGYSYVLWDDSGYCQGPVFSLQSKRPLSDASSWQLRYEARYLDMLSSDYDYQQGWQHRATGEFITRADGYRLLLAYTLEENSRHDDESSPRRHLMSANLEIYPMDRLSIRLMASYRDSFYDQSGSEDRNEDRYETSLMFNYTLSAKWEVRGNYSHTVNISSSPLYDFRRNITTIALGYSF